ncbi:MULTISPECIES: amidohydrolase family protein [Gammaproteobacteria]|uniref:amidohydrolase family protein n=1 Tax=Gammaproteobacteria TaxID=1236 RepID=UPI000DD072BB|nr:MULTISPECIES: amidohydrolase family protein [Gammaproteobacteria]RTE86611.1 metal-dependent hydrolase [Aliidiomarina sp. B3213]TCZ90834.1 metal-dependent hydrolase [Lysobacter sp. N42]
MKKIFLIIAVLAVFISAFALLPTPDPTPDAKSNNFILGPVHIFDGRDAIQEKFMEVRDGHIYALHESMPDSDLVHIDGQSRWVTPGLIDAHVHAWGNALVQTLSRGVTTVVDMFGDPNFLMQHRAQREVSEYTHNADIFGAGLLVTAPDGHGTQYGISVPTMSSPDQAEQLVEQRIESGSDFIKIVYTRETSTYQHAPSISLEELTAVIEAAHANDMLAIVHIADHDSALDAVRAGADGLVHSFFDQVVSDELISLMQANGTFVIPTMIVYEGMLRDELNQEVLYSNDSLTIERSARSTLQRSFGADNQFPAHFYNNLLETTGKMHEAGIPILAGSDAPNPNTAHGWSLITEMLMLQKAGMPAAEVIRAATANTAQAFSLEHRGVIQPGVRADFVVLDSSPLTDLSVFLTPHEVWKNGFSVATQ